MLQEYQLLYLDNDIPINRSFYCNNGDIKGRGLEVHVLDNSQAKDCTGLTLKMIVKVPSGEMFEATVANGLVTVLNAATGIYQVLFPNNMGKGRLIAEIQLSNTVPEVIVSRKFSIVGDGSLTSDGSISATPQGGMLWNVLTNEAQRQADFQEVLNNTDVAVAEKFANLEAEYAPELNLVKSQLAETQTKADTASIKADAMASGSPKGVYTTLADLQTAYPTGTTGAYLVTADGKWYYYNAGWVIGGTYQATGIADTSVIEQSLNLSLKNKIKSNGVTEWLNQTAANGIPTGTASTTRLVSKRLIPVFKGQRIIVDTFTYNYAFFRYDGSTYIAGYTPLGVFEIVDNYNLAIVILRNDAAAISPNEASVAIKIIDAPTEDYLATKDKYKIIDGIYWGHNGVVNGALSATTYATRISTAAPVKVYGGSKITVDVAVYTYNIYILNESKVYQSIVAPTTNEYIIPTDCYIMIMALRVDGGSVALSEGNNIVITYTPENVLTSKRISIIGDSISTFTGFVKAGNNVYYTGANNGVKYVNQTYWKRLIDRKRLTLLVNNSYSGTKVCGEVGDTICGVARCESLDDGVNNPDVVLIYMGTNDYEFNYPLGTYDGSGTFPTTYNTFREAYVTMLKKVMTKYPSAKVYCCTLLHNLEIRASGQRTFPSKNANGNTIAQFNAVIREMCDLTGATLIELDKCGITYQNMSIYMGDYSAGASTHPNSAGMELMYKKALEYFQELN